MTVKFRGPHQRFGDGKVVSEKAIEIKPKSLPKEEKIKTSSFGVQPDSLQDNSAAAADTVSVKAGNTVAMENDDLKGP